MNDFAGFMSCILLTWLFTWLLSAPAIYPESIKHAESVCAANGGWARIDEGRTSRAYVTCENGAEFSYDAHALLEKKQ